MEIHIKVEGADELLRAFQQAPQIVQKEMRSAMEASVRHVKAEVQRRTPVRTGRLRRSIGDNVDVRGRTVRGIVGTNVYYGLFLEHGTKRGIYPRRFMAGGAEASEDRIQAEFEQATGRVVRRLRR